MSYSISPSVTAVTCITHTVVHCNYELQYNIIKSNEEDIFENVFELTAKLNASATNASLSSSYH